MAVSLICLALWPCGCQSDMLGFGSRVAISLICWVLVAVWLSVWYVGLWWPCGCQSDILGFGGRVAISLICWALMAVWLSV